MNEVMEKEIINIKNMIYELNGVEVMLDSDLAKLYNVETKRVNEAVNRNQDKFPKRISWVLTETEWNILRSQFATLEIKGQGKYSKYAPRVFTEQGVYMLATVLKSKIATEVSIRIMDTFVKMRHYINLNKNALPHRVLLLEEKVDNNTKRIDELFDKFNPESILNNFAFYKGDFYDAYSIFLRIIEQAKKDIIIVDNYAGKELLDMLKDVDKKLTIISQNISEVLKLKYESQYKNVTFINSDLFHDRFIIIDRKKLFLCGSSFKDMGKKCFIITHLKDKFILDGILKTIDIK